MNLLNSSRLRAVPVVAACLGFFALVAAAIVPVALGAAAETSAGPAAGSTPLDRYFEGLSTLRASFTQTVKDARGKDVDHSSGTLIVARPGKFRWEVNPKKGPGNGAGTAAGQLLVADGKNVWFLDRDLEQVTVKPMDSALSSTPAMLLTGVANLRDAFKLSDAGARDGLDWVLVEPKRGEADFRRALFGFAKGTLQRMIIDDRLGQTSTIELASIERNGRVAPEEVSFTPPAGTDVIGKPVT